MLQKLPKSKYWQTYLTAGIPDYLAKNYWWAYLSPWGVRIFDHPFIVNRILWGQYHKIARATLNRLRNEPAGQLAEISCAYGEIIPLVANQSGADAVTLLDIAPIQLRSAQHKLHSVTHCPVQILTANAEVLPLRDNSFDTTLLFFLLHELPETARANAISEALRITKSNGRLLIADYGPFGNVHFFHRYKLFRSIFEKLEPFLAKFWRCDLEDEIIQSGRKYDKKVKTIHQQTFLMVFTGCGNYGYKS